VLTTRAASTLFRTLLAGITEHACQSHTKAVIFEEPAAERYHQIERIVMVRQFPG